MEFYDLTVKTPQGKTLHMSDFKGKVVLIVNTATQCGLSPQFKELEELHRAYKDRGLVIIGFPCNQFAKQEPETNATMEEHCLSNFGVSFQLTEKINVNGKNTHPIFRFLKRKLRGFLIPMIKWNFTKFLIDAHGVPYKRYSPTTKPGKLKKDIERLLND